MKEKVQEALNKIRPQLQADGGDVELVEVTEGGLVKVRLTGACKGCPMSQMTLKMGIEKFLKTAGPGSDGGGCGLKAGDRIIECQKSSCLTNHPCGRCGPVRR